MAIFNLQGKSLYPTNNILSNGNVTCSGRTYNLHEDFL